MSEPEKKTLRGRPKKIVVNPETPIEKKAKGRPRTDKPLTERRKLYDLRFSLKKMNMVEDDITKVIDLINKLNADRVAKQSKQIDELHEKKE
jgi:hypothetical protein